MAKTTKRVSRAKREKKNVPTGIIHIRSTFNNTIITITDHDGNVIASSSAGRQGFKGSRKSTPFAAQLAAQDALRQAMEQGMRTAEVRVKGFSVSVIRDVTPIPHNGCRPPKRRRI
jgi:small subunit ribosomal protein S11